jgi:hypothetical protein
MGRFTNTVVQPKRGPKVRTIKFGPKTQIEVQILKPNGAYEKTISVHYGAPAQAREVYSKLRPRDGKIKQMIAFTGPNSSKKVVLARA